MSGGPKRLRIAGPEKLKITGGLTIDSVTRSVVLDVDELSPASF